MDYGKDLRNRKGSVSVKSQDESESIRRSYFSTSNVKSKILLSLKLIDSLQINYKAWIRILLFVIPSSVDPLAFYIPAINDDKKCLNLHKQLLSTAFVFSLACKIFVMIVSLFSMVSHLMFERGNWGSYKLFSFLIDFLISIPVSEMVLPHLMVNMTGSELWDAINFIIIQYVARIIRIYSFSRELVEATWPRVEFNLFLYLQAANVFGSLWYFMAIKRGIECWNKACINNTGKSHCSFNCNDNLEYTFVSELCPTKNRNTTIHDFGIFHAALESGIVEDTNIRQKFLHCFVWGLQNLSNLGCNLQTSSDLRENIFVILVVSSGLMLFVLLIGNCQTYLLIRTLKLKEMSKKPREMEECEPFQKIYKDIQQQTYLPSRTLKLKEMSKKLQEMSKKPQEMSKKPREMEKISKDLQQQRYLASRTLKLKEMSKKPQEMSKMPREMELWEPFQKISKDLQQEVKKYKPYWRKTNHIDVVSFVNNLPEVLRMKVKRELCRPLVKKVCERLNFYSMEETLDVLCDRVKPAFFTDHTYIVREGDPIDEMIFVLQGKLRTYTKDITSGTTSSDNKRDDGDTTIKNDHLQDGGLYGEELIDWVLGRSHSLDIPKSNRTIQALTNVEAFILMVDDLEDVIVYLRRKADLSDLNFFKKAAGRQL